MLSFSSFIQEAKFSEDNFDRLLGAFEKRMPKLLGSPIYRLGGPSGSPEKLGAASGYLYFFDETRAFRIRALAGQMIAIDIWDEYHPNKGPSFVADLSNFDASSIINAMSKIAVIVKSPSASEVSVKEEQQLDEMAKRVADDSFYKLMVDTYGQAGARDVSWEQIKTVADRADVLIPAYIRSQKIGRGRWNSTPNAHTGAASGGGDAGDAPAVEASKKKEPILYIKVTAQDPDTKRFIPSGDSEAAQKLYNQLQNSLSGPATAAEMKDPDTLYGHMSQLVQMAVGGTLRSLLIYGGPGTGKTFTIMKTINDAGMVKGKDYQKLSGKASPVEIYKTLFMFRDSGLIVFDDLDSMWGNADATNVLKAALDTSPVREISWASANTVNVSKMDEREREEFFAKVDDQITDDPSKVKYPSSFDFKGRVIFISNLKKDEFDPAILSRSAKINMDLSPEQILERMRKILPTLGGDDVPMEQKEELLDHLLVMHKKKEITAVTMREFTKGLDIVRSGVPNWKDLVIYA